MQSLLEKKITFDRFIRGIVILLIAVVLIVLINRLSAVLVPFFVAWLLAYMIYPLVHFLQYKVRLPGRVLSIITAWLLVLILCCGALAAIVPSTITEANKVHTLFVEYMQSTTWNNTLMHYIDSNVARYANTETLLMLLQQKSTYSALQFVGSKAWTMLYGTFDFIMGIVGLVVIVLYTFFILMDYETISEGWIRLIPQQQRALALMVVQDVKNGMSSYFRGQALVAFIVGILFSIGFLIVGLPLAIPLGLFIGLLNLVPYMQTLGFIPTIILALLQAADTGQNFWIILLCCLAVFAVVQCIQDFLLVPRIMGRVTGLNPAVILLSLSIWGSLLGIIGFIIALPLTTLALSYYRRFVLHEGIEEAPTTETEKA